MRAHLALPTLTRRGRPADRAAADQRAIDVALCLSRQSIRPAPPRRG